MCSTWALSLVLFMAVALAWAAPALAADPGTSRAARRTPIVDVFEHTRDAVVNIAATQIVERRVQVTPFDELFNWPRGANRQRFTTTSLGSGFVIHPGGYVVTNAHVVASSAAQKVIFADKKEYDAERVAIDERHDIAVLKINAGHPLPAITLGRSDDLMIGETVIAIGNPLGYEHTVTSGIVSAVNRKLSLGDDVEYSGLIQTDASINRGNSGGPLLNVLSELIGINSAIRGDAQNIGFAIPVDTLRLLLPEMLSIERRKRLEVGLRLSWRGRVYIAEAHGPAAAAKIEPGDELVSVNGKAVKQDLDYYIDLLNINAKDRITLELRRDKKTYTAVVQPKPIPIPDGARLLREKFGVSVKLLTKEQAKELDLAGGLLITAVESGSPADQAGFQRNHLIVQIGKYFPSDLDEVGLMLEHVNRGEKMLFRVYEIRRATIELLEGYLAAR